MKDSNHFFNSSYTGEHLNRVAFPLGGIGAGMVCLEGVGAISHVSVRNKPDVYNEPLMFSALYVKGVKTARVLEGAVPLWKAFGVQAGSGNFSGCGNGLSGRTYGLPRFSEAVFSARFPFGIVHLRDDSMPVTVELTGWSPFIPGDADHSSLPVAGLEFRISNRTAKTLEAVYSFHSVHFMKTAEKSGAAVLPIKGGFILHQPPVKEKPEDEGAFAAFAMDPSVKADCGWFRGGWFDSLTMAWKNVSNGRVFARPPHRKGDPANGGSLYVPFKLKPHEEKTIHLLFCWHAPMSKVRAGEEQEGCCSSSDCKVKLKNTLPGFVPWYAGRFRNVQALAAYWRKNYMFLRRQSRIFSDCFHDTTLPPEVVEAVAANLTILKSPTCLRQTDGRFWGWEGCHDAAGCCHGTCTHVWNYAQTISHLFPSLERGLRETEFMVNQNEKGHHNFRASIPIRPPGHKFHSAADGQLGGLIKLYREWRISGDTAWMQSLWPKAKQSLDYCIVTWDPDHTGALLEPHHNTYDIEFWGADGMCTSFYLGALHAAALMGKKCGEDVRRYRVLLEKGRRAMENKLWNGNYYIQRVQWKGLRAKDPTQVQSIGAMHTPEALALLKKEGPKYQYGTGCLSDGVLGDWMARCAGISSTLKPKQVRKHLESVFKHNFRGNLSDHANPQRPGYAFGQEGGLLLCSWPDGGKPTLPFPYSDEVWTGIEYQVASHLIMMGRLRDGLRIVRTVRKRYDGRYRNPFNEYECGHWYARAMASYGLLQALSGARYDAVEKILYLNPAVKGDFRAFLSTATGFGTVGIRNGKPFFGVKSGKIEVKKMVLGEVAT
ncbi:MAG: GH116 family glycosyl hydrolase [Verrucomicrobiae bacterium]|nr:GH116 family glycosyl hydrolase [Verrucomicrobiae bacterium]